MSYKSILELNEKSISKKSILIIGAGYMASQYASALHDIGLTNVMILSQKQKSSLKLAKKYKFKNNFGEIEKILSEMPKMDLVIITTPILKLFSVTKLALKYGQTNILIEKPASLDSKKLLNLAKKNPDVNIKVGFNRLQYPTFHLIKELCKNDGGITSCTFTITEWIKKIDFKKFEKPVLERWGIANSLHVISMVFELIGFPKKFSCIQTGELKWHHSGSIFVGSGISENNIPFSYHGDWNSSGRWGITIMTKKHAFQLMPLEELYMCKINSTNWEKIEIPKSSNSKYGLIEQILLMLENKKMCHKYMMSLEKTSSYIKIAEKIFGYKNTK